MSRKPIYTKAAIEFIPVKGEMFQDANGVSVKAKVPMVRIYGDASEESARTKLLSLKNAIICAEQAKRIYEIEALQADSAESARNATETDATITSDAVKVLQELGLSKAQIKKIVLSKLNAK
jgi:hypothetical protein